MGSAGTSREPRERPDGPTARAALVVLAGGSGSRVGAALNKVYLRLAGRRLVSWSFAWAAQVPEFTRFVLVVRPQDAELARETALRECAGLRIDLVVGGGTRHQSESAAIDHLADAIGRGEVNVVAVHDGARPLSGAALFRSVVTTAAAVGGAVPALPAEGVLRVGNGVRPAAEGLPPAPDDAVPAGVAALVRVQTPQAFRAGALLQAYAAAAAAGYQGTDTACTVETCSDLAVRVVAGSRQNIKITYPHDLLLAERLLTASPR